MMKNPHSVQPKKPLFDPAQADAHWRTEIGADRRQTRIPPAQPWDPDWRKAMRRRVARLRAADAAEYRREVARYLALTPERMAGMMRNFARSEEGMTLQTVVMFTKRPVHVVDRWLCALESKGLIEMRIVYDGTGYMETWFLRPPPDLKIVARGIAPLDAPWPRPTPPPTTKPAA
jgi:hypothetical protein